MVKFGGGVDDDDDDDDIESLLVDKSLEGGEDSGGRVADVKKLKKNARKPPKPPRPPKGPLILDAADRKLVRELAELAMRKRARVERIKALKKMKAAKVSSLNSGLSAMVIRLITLIFFLVITFQGLSSRSTASVRLHGSPELGVAASESLISVQYYKDSFAYESSGPGSGSLSFAEEQVSGSGPGEEVGEIAR